MSEIYRFTEPGDDGRVEIYYFSREYILAYYYPEWCERMRKLERDHLISEDNCIDDWVAVHWAAKIEEK